MKSVGIIAEYNPFHNGHLYHLNKVQQMFPNHLIVLVLSGNYTQRGKFSTISRDNKTKIALKYGIDLVVELPYIFATQSADFFAHGSISLLNKLNVEHIIFGSETNDIDLLKSIATKLINEKETDSLIKQDLALGNSYPSSISNLVSRLINKNINTPNDILGICYLKEIIKNKYNIIPHTIKRTNNYHNVTENKKNISASNIREKIKNKEDISYYIPEYPLKYINKDEKPYFDIIKYNIIVNINNLEDFLLVDKPLAGRIRKCIYQSNSYEELINNIKTKKYTYSSITRVLCHIMCNYKKIDKDEDVTYIRVLGANKNGLKYLKSIDTDIPVVTRFSDLEEKYELLEKKLNYLYYMNMNNVEKLDEIKSKIIIN